MASQLPVVAKPFNTTRQWLNCMRRTTPLQCKHRPQNHSCIRIDCICCAPRGCRRNCLICLGFVVRCDDNCDDCTRRRAARSWAIERRTRSHEPFDPRTARTHTHTLAHARNTHASVCSDFFQVVCLFLCAFDLLPHPAHFVQSLAVSFCPRLVSLTLYFNSQSHLLECCQRWLVHKSVEQRFPPQHKDKKLDSNSITQFLLHHAHSTCFVLFSFPFCAHFNSMSRLYSGIALQHCAWR